MWNFGQKRLEWFVETECYCNSGGRLHCIGAYCIMLFISDMLYVCQGVFIVFYCTFKHNFSEFNIHVQKSVSASALCFLLDTVIILWKVHIRVRNSEQKVYIGRGITLYMTWKPWQATECLSYIFRWLATFFNYFVIIHSL